MRFLFVTFCIVLIFLHLYPVVIFIICCEICKTPSYICIEVNDKHRDQISNEYMCPLRKIAKCDYQESVNTGQTHRRTSDKMIPMGRLASQATQKLAISVTLFANSFSCTCCICEQDSVTYQQTERKPIVSSVSIINRRK